MCSVEAAWRSRWRHDLADATHHSARRKNVLVLLSPGWPARRLSEHSAGREREAERTAEVAHLLDRRSYGRRNLHADRESVGLAWRDVPFLVDGRAPVGGGDRQRRAFGGNAGIQTAFRRRKIFDC